MRGLEGLWKRPRLSVGYSENLLQVPVLIQCRNKLNKRSSPSPLTMKSAAQSHHHIGLRRGMDPSQNDLYRGVFLFILLYKLKAEREVDRPAGNSQEIGPGLFNEADGSPENILRIRDFKIEIDQADLLTPCRVNQEAREAIPRG